MGDGVWMKILSPYNNELSGSNWMESKIELCGCKHVLQLCGLHCGEILWGVNVEGNFTRKEEEITLEISNNADS